MLIEQAGGLALRLPLFEIGDVADRPAAAACLAAARTDDRWLFTSVNAVRHASALCPLPWPATAAVGAVTARALQQLTGVEAIAPEDGDGAAALFEHPALQAIAGQRFLVVTGEQTLPVLEAGLRARNAEVEVLAVYRRLAIEHRPAVVARMIAAADVAIVPSGEALARLVAITPDGAQQKLKAMQLALPSPRVIETARVMGFQRPPLLPPRVSDAAYLEVLSRHAPASP